MLMALEVKKSKKEILEMKKTMMLMAALLFVTLVGSFAQAQQQCYQLEPYSDVIKLSHTTVGAHTALFGNWTSVDYTLPVVGAREANLGGGPKRVSLNGTNDTSDFDANPICAIDGVVNGAWTITCVGGTSGNFTVTGTAFAPVSCANASAVQGPVAGKSK